MHLMGKSGEGSPNSFFGRSPRRPMPRNAIGAIRLFARTAPIACSLAPERRFRRPGAQT